jgi:hypothetical protein
MAADLLDLHPERAGPSVGHHGATARDLERAAIITR